MPGYVPPGPKKFVTKGCLQGTWQGAFLQQREVFGRPRKGEVSCCFLLPHLCLRGGKSNIAIECWAIAFSPLSSLWKQLLYGKDGALTVITPAHLSFVLVAGKEGTCVSMGRDQLINGVLDQKWVVSSSQRRWKHCSSISWCHPSGEGLWFWCKRANKTWGEEGKCNFPKVAAAFKLISDPHEGKGSPLDASSPIPPQGHCPQPRQCCAGRKQKQDRSHSDVAADHSSAVNHQLWHRSCPDWVTCLILLHNHLQKDMILKLCSPLPPPPLLHNLPI